LSITKKAKGRSSIPGTPNLDSIGVGKEKRDEKGVTGGEWRGAEVTVYAALN